MFFFINKNKIKDRRWSPKKKKKKKKEEEEENRTWPILGCRMAAA
jgi:hypothetical protein